MPNVTFLNFSQ